MSVLTYNGITLPYGDTTYYRQRAVRDDMGDTDWYVSQYEITQNCLISIDYLSMLAPDLVGGTSIDLTSAAGVMKVIYQRLMQHRRRLSFQFNGVELIPQPQDGNKGVCDAQNGPKPQYCSFTELTDQLFLLSYSIIAHYWVNPKIDKTKAPIITNNPGNDVLYNRWTEMVEMDATQRSTRTRDGKFMIRSDNVDGAIADDVRPQFAVTGVPNGFLRTESKYTVDPSGLALEYHIKDVEQFKMPPPPAFVAEGDYIESTTVGGAVRYGEVKLRVKGDNSTSQVALQKAAIKVAWQKLNIKLGTVTIPQPNGPGQTFQVLQGAAVKVNMYKNEVDVHIKAMLQPTTKRVSGLAMPGANVVTPGSDFVKYSPDYRSRGTARLLLQAASYYDPSLKQTVLNHSTNQSSTGAEVGTAGKNKEA